MLRFLARFVDSVVAGVPCVILVLIAPGSFFAVRLGMLLAAAYVLVCDGLDVPFMRHRSLGKGLLNLCPERLDGQPMTVETSARRNGVFAVSYLGVLPAIGWFASLAGLALIIYETYRAVADPDGRRWGDELAGTKVFETSA